MPARFIFKGPPEIFDRLDRNHDALLKKDDFDWSPFSAYARAATVGTAVAAGTTTAGAQLLANDEERAIALDQLDGDIGDVAGPSVRALAIVAISRAHPTVEE